HPGKQELATASEGPKFLDDLDGLGCERDYMRSPCFTRGESPLRRLEVDVLPPRLPKFARPHEQHRSQLERRRSDRRSLVSIHGPQEVADLRGIGDAGQMFGPVLLQGARKRIRGVVVAPSGSDGIPEDPSGKRLGTICTLDDSPPLEFA